MKIGKALLIGVFLLLGLSTSQVAEPGGQAGGVPTLDTRVRTLETKVADQGTAGAALQLQVNTVESQVDTIGDDVASLLGRVATLETALELHLPMFAVVESDGTLRPSSSRGVLKVERFLDSDGKPLPGGYKVFFLRNDVSMCAVTVTAEPGGNIPIRASVNGTFRGMPSPSFPENMFTIDLFDRDDDPVDHRFNVIVTC